MSESEKTGIDRRSLIKGAAAVGGAVWAVPVVQTLHMPVAAAVSPNRPVLPGSSGALFTNASPWVCGGLTAGDVQCLDNTPETSDGCNHATAISDPNDHTQLVVCIAPGFTLAQGRARCADGSCTEAVPNPSPNVILCSETWLFSCGGGDFHRAE